MYISLLEWSHLALQLKPPSILPIYPKSTTQHGSPSWFSNFYSQLPVIQMASMSLKKKKAEKALSICTHLGMFLFLPSTPLLAAAQFIWLLKLIYLQNHLISDSSISFTPHHLLGPRQFLSWDVSHLFLPLSPLPQSPYPVSPTLSRQSHYSLPTYKFFPFQTTIFQARVIFLNY